MNPLIEQALEKGLIDKEAALRLESFEGQIKEANFLGDLKDALLTTAKHVGPSMLGTVATLMGADYLTSKHYKKMRDAENHNLDGILSGLLQDPDFQGKEDSVRERFNEIRQFSPTLAQVPSVAKPLLKRTLDGGLSEVDLKNLSIIEGTHRRGHNEPMSATLLKATVPNFFSEAGKTLAAMPDIQEARLKGLPSSLKGIMELVSEIKEKGIQIPSEVDITKGEGSKADRLERAMNFLNRNPEWLRSTIIKNRLQDMANDSFLKQGAANLSLEKRAHILADQYLLLKTAKFNLSPLMALGAAALFGASGALIEEGADYARSVKANKSIEESWKETDKSLAGMHKNQARSMSGIDYSSKETKDRAQKAFKVLVDIAPSLAMNSTIATPFVARSLQQEGDIAPDAIKMLSETQKNLNTTREYRSPFADSPLAEGFGRGFQAAGGKEFIKSVAKVLADG